VALVQTHFTQPTGVGQEQLSQMVQQAVTGRGFQKQNPRAVNAALVNFAMRGLLSPFLDTPTNEELMASKAEDVLGAAQSLWGYKRIVTYAGPRSADDVAAVVAPAGNGGAALAEPPAREPVLYIDARRNRVLYVDAPGAQAQVGLLSADGYFDPKAYPSARVYNEYMSGSMGSVVFQEVREARSLAYSAWTNYRTPNHNGDQNMMMGMLTCQTDKTVEAVDVLLGLIRNLPPEEERIDRVRKAVDQQYRSNRLTYRRLPGATLTWDRWGIGEDPREYNWQTATKMTLDDLEKFASRFTDRPFTVTITGDVSRIDMDALKRFGELEEMQPDDLFAW
jgi:predicted Zn-dependent peptidase